MINLSIKIIRTGLDVISFSSAFYLLVASLNAANSPFQSFVLYPLLLIGIAGSGYFFHSGLNKLAQTVAGYRIKVVKISNRAISKQLLAH